MASVAFHPAEDHNTASLLEDTMRVFKDLPIKEIFRISYPEFMKLPIDYVEMMIKIAKEHLEKEKKVASEASNAMNSAMKQRQNQQIENLKVTKGLKK